MTNTEEIPVGTTTIFTDHDGKVFYYKEMGLSKYGNMTYVRWVNTRQSWTKTPEASEHPRKYGVPYKG